MLIMDQSPASFHLKSVRVKTVILGRCPSSDSQAFGQAGRQGNVREAALRGPSRGPSASGAHQGSPAGPGGPHRDPEAGATPRPPSPPPQCHPSRPRPSGHARASGRRNVTEAGSLDAGNVVLPVEVGLHVAGAAVIPVRGLHRLVDAPPIDRRRQHTHWPLALLLGVRVREQSALTCPARVPRICAPPPPGFLGPLHADAAGGGPF